METIINLLSEKRKSLVDAGHTSTEIEKYLTDAFELALLRTVDADFKNLSEEKFKELEAHIKAGDLDACRDIFSASNVNNNNLEERLVAEITDVFAVK